METKVGQVDWNEKIEDNNIFMRLKQGENKVRILTNPYQFWVHWLKESNKRIKCALEDCPLCKQGNNATRRWYTVVFSRELNQPKLLEISKSIFTGIQEYLHNSEWGDVRRYDITIKKNPNPPNPNKYYTIMPSPKAKLTEEEISAIKEFKEKLDMDKLVKPPTKEEVLEQMGVGTPVPQTPAEEPQVAVGTQTVDTPANQAPVITADDFNFDDDDL